MNPLYMQEIEELEQQPAEARERFRVTDLASANWCMRKLAALKAQERDTNNLADAEIERIESWRRHELDKLRGSMEYLEMLLTEYHKQVLAQDTRAKTISTPYGKLKARRLPPKVEYDEEMLLAWAKGAGRTDFVRVREELAKDAIRDAVLRGGEAVPGVTVIDQGVKFSVEVTE
ncbi:host-nuclease inhibitor Gam family protein [Alicyclobacillus macrosporangiidus]|uniref:host-nuclease inhibitor Gam family protein n=1 Tax=Alicyclobacillus macrosporangiidus TaxID=392015 RepID=UPI000942FFE7|nr:host-nuclease inhibitor Gam family protein [Alicyclobacillus macrosporangiidus]